MEFLKKAAAATGAAAKSAVQATKAKVADLRAAPTQVRCSACPHEIEVPATAFDWHCAAGHLNRGTAAVCEECKLAPPEGLVGPSVTCPACQVVTVVPASNARKHVRETATKTKEFAVATAVATKQGVAHLRAAPTTFHCAHCNTLLAVPTGPWACQTCTSENEEECETCKQCAQKKAAQKAICGVCRQSTVIPGSNFTDSIKSGVKNVTQGSKKVYFDVAGKPYLTCGKCSAHVSIPKSHVAETAAAGPAADGEGLGSAPSASPASAAPEGVYNGGAIQCPSCKNPIEEA